MTACAACSCGMLDMGPDWMKNTLGRIRSPDSAAAKCTTASYCTVCTKSMVTLVSTTTRPHYSFSIPNGLPESHIAHKIFSRLAFYGSLEVK
jgi:hypothetical protein